MATSETLEGEWHPRQRSLGEIEIVEQALHWYPSAEDRPATARHLKVAKPQAIAAQGLEKSRRHMTRRSKRMAIENPLRDKEQAEGTVSEKLQRAGGSLRARRYVISRMAGILNPLVLGHAGSRRRFKFAVIHHQGRRSGRAYATPTSARPLPDGFVVPMTFGEGADWVRNVQAAGGCVIEWEGTRYTLVHPEVVDLAAIHSAFSRIERVLLPVIGIKQFLRLRLAPTSSAEPV